MTYAEAYTMLIRALGLEPAVKGPWPIGVINLAHEIGLTDGINGAANAPIPRADMAAATENALFASYKWDKEEEELVEVDDGSASLIVKKHKWDEDDWADRAGVSKVTGEFDRVTLGGDIRVDGKNYAIDDYEELVVELNKDAAAAKAKANIGADVDWDRDALEKLFVEVDSDRVTFSVTLTLNDNDKVTKIAVNVDTIANGELSRVTVEKNETDFGTVRVDGDPINVDDDTDVYVNGKKATLADAKEALEDFRDEWGSNADAIATVRTRGNDPDKPAIYVSILTNSTVSGTVTSRGSDSDGAWVRIDGTKYYNKNESDELNVDKEVTVLLGHDDKIYIVLDGESAVDTDTWARVISYTVDKDDHYVTTFQLADNTQFTLRVKENDSHVYDPTPENPDSGDERDVNWQKQINDALADNLSPHLIFVHFDGNDVKAMVASKSWDDYPHSAADVKSGRVESISATRIVLKNAGTFTLAPDAFYWDLQDEEFIRRVDITEDDNVDVFIADGLVMAVILR